MSETTAVSVIETAAVTAADFMPVFTVQQAVERKSMVNQFIGQVLRDGEDYGKLPGGRDTKILLKPGAEKLCSIFGLSVTYAEDKIIEDWTGADHDGEPLFYYSYRCQLSRGGRFMGESIGSCNSWESKYRYRWVPEEVASQRPDFDRLVKRGGVTTVFEPSFAIDKKETSGKYGKPAEYWAMFEHGRRTRKMLGKKEFDGVEVTMDQTQYRVPNPDIADVLNTCQKMAQKRALVAAVLVVTNCSDAFTQDIEDFDVSQPERPDTAPVYDHAPMPERPIEPARTFPPKMEALLISGASSAKEFKAAVTTIHDWMITKSGEEGDKAAIAIGNAFKAKYPKATDVNPLIARALLIEMWDALMALPSFETPFDEEPSK